MKSKLLLLLFLLGMSFPLFAQNNEVLISTPHTSLLLSAPQGGELKFLYFDTKLLQKSEMRKEIVIELSYKGFSRASDYS